MIEDSRAWKKMTPAAQAIAKTLPYAARERALLDQALEPFGAPDDSP